VMANKAAGSRYQYPLVYLHVEEAPGELIEVFGPLARP
jgi:hypothetical protein